MNYFVLQRFAILLSICILFFFLGNGYLSLTDPDEVFYALTAKEMMARHSWFVPYIFDHPQFEKPILTYWLLIAAFKNWGMTSFAARFFPAVFATLGVLGVYLLGLFSFKEERKAFLSALVLASAALFIGIGKTLFTDMIFAVFILYALVAFFWAFCRPDQKSIGFILVYFFAALATLTKGPLGLLIPEAVILLFLMYRRDLEFVRNQWVLMGFALYMLMTLPWYIYMIQNYGGEFIHEFFYNDHWRRFIEAEHKANDHWYFYPLTMVGGLFPWSLFFVAALVDLYHRLKWNISAFEHFLLSWIFVVFMVFQLAHSKLASYILPIFPALALLTGSFICEHLTSMEKQRKIQNLTFVTSAIIVVLGIAVVAASSVFKKYIPSYMPVFFLSAALITLAGFVITLAFKDRWRWALYVLSFATCPVFLTSYFISRDIEPFVSSYEATTYLPQTSTVLLTSKPYARGLKYYTGNNVAVLDPNGQNYFSPHPIPILNTDENLFNFLNSQKLTYGLLKKGGYEHLKKLSPDHFQLDLIKKSGTNFIVKIEPLHKT